MIVIARWSILKGGMTDNLENVQGSQMKMGEFLAIFWARYSQASGNTQHAFLSGLDNEEYIYPFSNKLWICQNAANICDLKKKSSTQKSKSDPFLS